MLLSGDEIIEACAVIYAGGTESIKHINGEAEFLGKGVSYCATCDGFCIKVRRWQSLPRAKNSNTK